MAARKTKKTSARKPAPAESPFTVVLEDLRSKFAVFGEALQGLREQVVERFEQVDRRFEQIDKRFEQVGRELLEVRKDLAVVQSAAFSNTRETRALHEEVKDLRQRMESALDEHDDRITKLEGAA